MELQSKRLRYRPFSMDDAVIIYELCKDSDVGPMCGWKPHESIEETKEILSKFLINDFTFCICDREDKTIYGLISIGKASVRKEDEKAREIGYWLGKPYWGNGYMKEAIQTMLSYLFNELDVDIVECGHFPWNHQSKRVIEKSGFVYEGCMRKIFYRTYDNTWLDVCEYSIKKEEYIKNNA